MTMLRCGTALVLPLSLLFAGCLAAEDPLDAPRYQVSFDQLPAPGDTPAADRADPAFEVDPSLPAVPPGDRSGGLDAPAQAGAVAPPTQLAPRVVASGDLVAALAGDDRSVMWVTENEGHLPPAVRVLDLIGGNVMTVVETGGIGSPVAVAGNASSIFFTDYGTGRVMGIDRFSGDQTVIATEQAGPYGIAVAGDRVYWTNLDEGTISRTSIKGGPIEVLASGLGAPGGLGVVGNTIYWAGYGSGTIEAMLIDGSRRRVIATGQGVSSPFAADDSHVYWTDALGRALMSARLSDDKVEQVAGGQYAPVGLGSADGSIYFATRGDGLVKRATPASGAVDALVTAPVMPAHVAIAGGEVIFTGEADGVLYGFPR